MACWIRIPQIIVLPIRIAITYKADLKVTITDGKTAAVAGSKDTYTIVVTNAGSSDVAGAVIGDTFPTIFTGVTFTASQTGGATGFTAAGSGDITDTVTMPATGKITYKATGTISTSATGSISNTVTVTSPNNVPDPNTANNTCNRYGFAVEAKTSQRQQRPRRYWSTSKLSTAMAQLSLPP